MGRISLAIHGGAGVFPREHFPERLQERYLKTLDSCLDKGWKVLERGGSALEAVEKTVRALEDTPLFNAGRGSVLNEKGRIECDAAIMTGDGRAGAVAAVRGVKNPISLARSILDDDRVVFIAGAGAERWADKHKLKRVPESYFITEQRKAELKDAKATGSLALDRGKFGTVGAVARDRDGRLAAATSTGGLTNKVVSRVSDSAVIGAGNYANDATCAVSCTGVGEVFIREVVAHEISARMQHGGQSLKEAVCEVVHDVLLPIDGIGGVIAVDATGRVCLENNSPSMYRAWRSGSAKPQSRIFGTGSGGRSV
jgi:L-asparaginase / beta-aspartyl-peptidase